MENTLRKVFNSYLTEEELKECISAKPNLIRLVDNPSEEIQLIAVKQCPYVIKFIKNPTEAAQFLLLREGGMLLYSIY